MSAYVVAPAADDDLATIWYYYAETVGDPDLADRIIAGIVSGFHRIAKAPGIGHLRRDLAEEPLHFWAVRKFLIIYRGRESLVEIVRVLHGSRDVQAILENDKE